MQELFMSRDGQRYGPFPEHTVRQLIAERKLVGTDLVWFSGMDGWAPASAALSSWFPVVPLVPPPLPAVRQSTSESVFAAPGGAVVSVFERIQAQPVAAPSPFASVGPGEGAAPFQAQGPQPAMPTQTPVALAVSAPAPAAPQPTPDSPAAPLSKTWDARFNKIEQILGVGLSKLASLSFAETLATRMGVHGTGLNILAGVFGPFYYLAKGMWRPAISLTVPFVVISQLAAMAVAPLGSPGFAYAVNFSIGLFVFGGSANLYYYRKVRMGDKSWW